MTPRLLKLKVYGLTCEGCENAVHRALNELDGIKNIEVSAKKKKLKLEYDPNLVKEEAIVKKIDELGYDWEKGFFQRWMDRMIENNEKEFGNNPMSCCSVNKKIRH